MTGQKESGCTDYLKAKELGLADAYDYIRMSCE